MAEYMTQTIQQTPEGLMFLNDPAHGFKYDYFSYNPTMTEKMIPKKMITFFFLNLMKRMNFKILRETHEMSDIARRAFIPMTIGQVCFFLLIIVFIICKGFFVWLYLIVPVVCAFINIMFYAFGRNIALLETNTTNQTIRSRVTEFLAVDNIYWFLKYLVVFEMDEDLNLTMIEVDKKYQVSEREYEMVSRLSKTVPEDVLRKWKEDLDSDGRLAAEEGPEKRENDWAKSEFNVFFKYNKWDVKK